MMGMRPLLLSANIPEFANPIWFNTNSTEEDKQLYHLEQEISTKLERVEQKHCDLTPIGTSTTSEVKPINYVDDDEDEEDDDNDVDESESHDNDVEEIEEHDSPIF